MWMLIWSSSPLVSPDSGSLHGEERDRLPHGIFTRHEWIEDRPFDGQDNSR